MAASRRPERCAAPFARRARRPTQRQARRLPLLKESPTRAVISRRRDARGNPNVRKPGSVRIGIAKVLLVADPPQRTVDHTGLRVALPSLSMQPLVMTPGPGERLV